MWLVHCCRSTDSVSVNVKSWHHTQEALPADRKEYSALQNLCAPIKRLSAVSEEPRHRPRRAT